MYRNLGFGKSKNLEAAKKDLMSRIDANEDGKLDCIEFIDLFHKVYKESNKPLSAIQLEQEVKQVQMQAEIHSWKNNE